MNLKQDLYRTSSNKSTPHQNRLSDNDFSLSSVIVCMYILCCFFVFFFSELFYEMQVNPTAEALFVLCCDQIGYSLLNLTQ